MPEATRQARVGVWKSVLGACGASLLWLAACASAGATAPTALPTPTSAPPPTSTVAPPPRPTNAPPALSAASSPVPSPGAVLTAKPRPARLLLIGYLGTLDDSGVLIAHRKGFAREQGVVAQLVQLDTPGQALSALNSGQVDAASLPVSAELFNALARGNLRIVAEAAGAPPGHGAAGLLARPELLEKLRTPTDLRGARLAIPARGHKLDAELDHLLKQGWLHRNDVESVVITPADVGAALAEGRIDGAMLDEPDLSRLEQLGPGRVWRRVDRIQPARLEAVLIFSVQSIRLYPEAVRNYLSAYLKAVRLYNDVMLKREAAGRTELLNLLMADGAPAGPAELETVTLPGINPNAMVNVQSLLEDQQYYRRNGLQSREVNFAAVVDTQFAAYAITRLGEYR